MKQELEKIEVIKLCNWATERYNLKRRNGVKNLQVGKNDSLGIDIMGALAEYAVCKKFGLDFNWELGAGDGGFDMEVKGKTIDVKCSATRNGHLLFKDAESFKADIAIYVEQESAERYFIKGCVSRREFFKQHVVKDFGHIDYYPTKDLWEAACVISGSNVFIGNQSGLMAITIALGHPYMQEVAVGCANCIFERKNAKYLR